MVLSHDTYSPGSLRWLMVLLLFTGVAYRSPAQVEYKEKRVRQGKTPAPIREYVSGKYPGAKNVKYFSISFSPDSSLYEVKLTSSGKESLDLLFTPGGKLLRTDRSIPYIHVPHDVRTTINKDLKQRFRAFKIDHCQEHTGTEGLEYEVILKGRSGSFFKPYIFTYDSAGGYRRHMEIIQQHLDMIFR